MWITCKTKTSKYQTGTAPLTLQPAPAECKRPQFPENWLRYMARNVERD